MSGAGFKTFGVGDVLTASDVNGYLMKQAVLNFADSGARGSAIGTATEGMLSYLADTDAVEVYDGSAWVGVAPTPTPPAVLQVVSTAKLNTFSTTSSSYVDVTGLTATITPSSASNKVLIVAQVTWSISRVTDDAVFFQLAGGNAATYDGGASSSRTTCVFGARFDPDRADLGQSANAFSIVYLDSPATTSATTYSVQAKAAQGTAFVNRTAVDTNSDKYARGASSITVMEVAA